MYLKVNIGKMQVFPTKIYKLTIAKPFSHQFGINVREWESIPSKVLNPSTKLSLIPNIEESFLWSKSAKDLCNFFMKSVDRMSSASWWWSRIIFSRSLSFVWCAAEKGKKLENWLNRELLKETKLKVNKIKPLFNFNVNLSLTWLQLVYRSFFEVTLPVDYLSQIQLREGKAVKAFALNGMLDQAPITPYDAFVLWFHANNFQL